MPHPYSVVTLTNRLQTISPRNGEEILRDQIEKGDEYERTGESG